MKTSAIVVALIVSLTCGCNANKKEKETLANNYEAAKDTSNKPDIRVKVNKQFDSAGNIIKYDSTYSYFYSSPGGGRISLENDSVYSRFKSYFDKEYPDFFKPHNDIFYNDSLFKYDFYNSDYFSKRFRMNQKLFDQYYHEMDSIKGKYLHEKYPNGYQKKK
jgi:hypothetical protein